MHVQANTVQPGDRVRGIGLVVEYVEPATDFDTRLVGKVSTVDPTGEWAQAEVTVTLPNNHIVNVARYVEPELDEFHLVEQG